MAFAIAEGSFEDWRAHLTEAGVTMRGEMHWPRGGRSLYFEDPDGHVLELATPGLWPTYLAGASAAASQDGMIASPSDSARRSSTIKPRSA